jgi:hypothetical protein
MKRLALCLLLFLGLYTAWVFIVAYHLGFDIGFERGEAEGKQWGIGILNVYGIHEVKREQD